MFLTDLLRPRLIVGALPVTLTNGTVADATQVMADLNWIVNQVNAGAAASGANADITSMSVLTAVSSPVTLGSNISITGSLTLSQGLIVTGKAAFFSPVDFANGSIQTSGGGINNVLLPNLANNAVFAGTNAWQVINQGNSQVLFTVLGSGITTLGAAPKGPGTLNLASNLFQNGAPFVNWGAASTSQQGVVQIAQGSNIIAGNSSLLALTPAQTLTALNFAGGFISAQQAITSAGALTIAHNLGRRPVLVSWWLVNISAELGYSLGDVVFVPMSFTAPTTNNGVSIVPDATNLNIRYGSGNPTFDVVRKDTGANAPITNANWVFQIAAWG